MERPQSSLLGGRWTSICLTAKEKGGGEGDRDEETWPWWEGPLWDCPLQEIQSSCSKGRRGQATLPPTRLTLGVHRFAGSTPPDTTQGRSPLGWNPPAAQA